MVRAIDLNQLANMLAAVTRLLETEALSPGDPDSGVPHPVAQRLPRDLQIVTFGQLLGGPRRPKV
jgi:hypothetical protein